MAAAIETDGGDAIGDSDELYPFIEHIAGNVAPIDAGCKDSFNTMLYHGFPAANSKFNIDYSMVDTLSTTEQDRGRKSIRTQFGITDFSIDKPQYQVYPTGKTEPLFPKTALETNTPYAGLMKMGCAGELTAQYTDGSERSIKFDVASVPIDRMLIMTGSDRCPTRYLTKFNMRMAGEDPADTQGTMNVSGNEYVFNFLENIAFNAPHIHAGSRAGEAWKLTFISQPDSNPFETSAQTIISHMKSGAIYIEMTNTKFKDVRFPFYLLYRAYEMTSDRDIIKTAVFDMESEHPAIHYMKEQLYRAFLHKESSKTRSHFDELRNCLDHKKVVEEMAAIVSKVTGKSSEYRSNENAVRYLNETLLKIFDKVLFPHIGSLPEDRPKKLRFLGALLHRMFLVERGLLPVSDRDALPSKRLFGPLSLLKAYKTHVNKKVVSNVIQALKTMVKKTSFESLSAARIEDRIINTLKASDFLKAMEEVIKAGNKEITTDRRGPVMNRVATQLLERKNILNAQIAHRVVTSANSNKSSKQTERADLRRQVVPSQVGFLCLSRSPDTGPRVGITKELAVSCVVSGIESVHPIIATIRADPDLIPEQDVDLAEIMRAPLARVSVNGKPVGFCRRSFEFYERFRAKKIAGEIPHMTSVVWSAGPTHDAIDFWADAGRAVRPVILVYSNEPEYIEACREAFRRKDPSLKIQFRQHIRLTKTHVADLIAGRIEFAELVRDGVVEWVSCLEQDNYIMAADFDELRRNQNDVTNLYTHCDIPQALLGYACHLSPYANNTQPVRVTYESNQGRQTAGWCSMNIQKVGKRLFFEYFQQRPLVETLTNVKITPNGFNVIVAYISNGDNQEDGIVSNASSMAAGLYGCLAIHSVVKELEKGEAVATPDPLNPPRNMKPNASYDKLVDGVVQVGARLQESDVMIGIIARPSKRSGEAQKDTDRSKVYNKTEDAVVTSVIRPRGPKGEIVIVGYMSWRTFEIGNKTSSRSGNKSINSTMQSQSRMPYLEDGTPVTVLCNPHSFPTRMTLGQIIETAKAKICARRGIVANGTAFLRVDTRAISDELYGAGFRYNGCERLYSGDTGRCYEAACFVGPTYYQHLLKFVKDEGYVVGSRAPTDSITGQPLDGKKANGGLRISELLAWTFVNHGTMQFLNQKFRADSDGRNMYLCRVCKQVAVYNGRKNVYECRICKENVSIVRVPSARASTIMLEELRSSGIHMDINTSVDA